MVNPGEQPLFENVNFDQEQYETDLLESPAPKTYVIYFTPRSGSSWLTSVVYASRRMGNPDEWFNPEFIPGNAQAFNADNLNKYVEMLKRKRSFGECFGAEITYNQMLRVFGDEETFLRLVAPQNEFYLTRADIVQQAVSLSKAAQTGIYHTVSSSGEDVIRADSQFVYSEKDIRKWVQHTLDQELKWEEMFERYSIHPIRLEYERILSLGSAEMARLIAREMGVDGVSDEHISSAHGKIGTEKNKEFASLFRHRNSSYLAEVDERRRRGDLPDLKR